MGGLNNYWRLIRPKQWVKNSFILAPLFFSGNLISSDVVVAVVGCLAFAMLSSSIYVLNDWCDIKADRQHKKKKLRPLASGEVRPIEAVFILIFLLSVLVALCMAFNFSFSAISLLVLYSIVNIGYSFGLKHVPILELLLVASGFIIRLLFGASILVVTLSPWILVCTGLLSLMLAVGKRRGDLIQSNDDNFKRRSLVGYNLTYLDQVNTFAATAVFTSYVVFCTSEYAISRFGGEILVTSPFVLFGILSYLKLLAVDGLGDDPTSLVLKSQGIRFALIGWLISFMAIIYY